MQKSIYKSNEISTASYVFDIFPSASYNKCQTGHGKMAITWTINTYFFLTQFSGSHFSRLLWTSLTSSRAASRHIRNTTNMTRGGWNMNTSEYQNLNVSSIQCSAVSALPAVFQHGSVFSCGGSRAQHSAWVAVCMCRRFAVVLLNLQHVEHSVTAQPTFAQRHAPIHLGRPGNGMTWHGPWAHVLHLFHQLPLGHQKPSILEDLPMKTGCSSAQQSVDCFTERHPAIQHGGISQATPRNRGSTWEILVMFSRLSFAVKCKMPCCITDFKSTEPRKTRFFGAWIAPNASHSHKQQS